jgi:hypothetical protein
MTTLTAQRVQRLAEDYPVYRRLRLSHPHRPAAQILRYMQSDPPETLEQFFCKHEFVYQDDDEVHGRSYCTFCGLDGDA